MRAVLATLYSNTIQLVAWTLAWTVISNAVGSAEVPVASAWIVRVSVVVCIPRHTVLA